VSGCSWPLQSRSWIGPQAAQWAVLSDGLDAVEGAVREALDAGAVSDEIVLNCNGGKSGLGPHPPSRLRIWR